MSDIWCGLCYSLDVDEDFICDTCDEYYCEDCSYSYTIHYQHQGCRCHECADQDRRESLSQNEKRDRKLKWLISRQ